MCHGINISPNNKKNSNNNNFPNDGNDEKRPRKIPPPGSPAPSTNPRRRFFALFPPSFFPLVSILPITFLQFPFPTPPFSPFIPGHSSRTGREKMESGGTKFSTFLVRGWEKYSLGPCRRYRESARPWLAREGGGAEEKRRRRKRREK